MTGCSNQDWPSSDGRDARPASPPRSWAASERHRAVVELARVIRRARTRPLRVALFAAAFAAMVVFLLARRGQTFEAEVIIRVSEGIIVDESTPLPRQKLEGYLRSIAFSEANLERIIDEHHLFPVARARGMRFAVEELLDRIELSLYSNYFAVDHGLDVPKTVRIAVIYTADDRANALTVARSIAQLIIDAASERRQTTSRALAELSSRHAHALEQALVGLEAEITTKMSALGQADDQRKTADLRVGITRLDRARERTSLALMRARQQTASLALRREADARRLGLAFTIADATPPPDPARREMLILAGALALAFAVPLSAIWVGAFDDRIHNERDVLRLGLPSLGSIPGVGARKTTRGRSLS